MLKLADFYNDIYITHYLMITHFILYGLRLLRRPEAGLLAMTKMAFVCHCEAVRRQPRQSQSLNRSV
ncbi:MAG: hypothetical protein BWY69_00641 [Planctomycetes bacterium ADurb.Bin401]|nr:MAG: hypothetical protein BWY69_00641 [Planctomycetes bacterium ADurb.Bin401]